MSVYIYAISHVCPPPPKASFSPRTKHPVPNPTTPPTQQKTPPQQAHPPPGRACLADHLPLYGHEGSIAGGAGRGRGGGGPRVAVAVPGMWRVWVCFFFWGGRVVGWLARRVCLRPRLVVCGGST